MAEITKERLKNYVYIRREVENQLERLERMEKRGPDPGGERKRWITAPGGK